MTEKLAPVLLGRKRREKMEKQEFLKVGKALIEALPSGLVKRFNLQEGSYLKIDSGDDRITLQPVTETEAEADRQAAFQQMYKAMDSVVKLEPNSFASDEEEDDWIAEQVKVQRKERHTTPHNYDNGCL